MENADLLRHRTPRKSFLYWSELKRNMGPKIDELRQSSIERPARISRLPDNPYWEIAMEILLLEVSTLIGRFPFGAGRSAATSAASGSLIFRQILHSRRLRTCGYALHEPPHIDP